jgi:hypothetical protein
MCAKTQIYEITYVMQISMINVEVNKFVINRGYQGAYKIGG